MEEQDIFNSTEGRKKVNLYEEFRKPGSNSKNNVIEPEKIEDNNLIPSHDLSGKIYKDLYEVLGTLHSFVIGRENNIKNDPNHYNQKEKVEAIENLKNEIREMLTLINIEISNVNQLLIATENAMKIDRDDYAKYGKFINKLLKIFGIRKTPESLKLFHDNFGFAQQRVSKIEITEPMYDRQLIHKFYQKGQNVTYINGRKTKMEKGDTFEIGSRNIKFRRSFTKLN